MGSNWFRVPSTTGSKQSAQSGHTSYPQVFSGFEPIMSHSQVSSNENLQGPSLVIGSVT